MCYARVLRALVLGVMCKFYASITATAIIQQRYIPPRPPQFDGWISVLKLPRGTEAEAVRARVAAYGEVLSVELHPTFMPGHVEAHVRFATHEQAKAAIAGLDAIGQVAIPVYNERPYDNTDSPDGRGWTSLCLMKARTSTLRVGLAPI